MSIQTAATLSIPKTCQLALQDRCYLKSASCSDVRSHVAQSEQIQFLHRAFWPSSSSSSFKWCGCILKASTTVIWLKRRQIFRSQPSLKWQIACFSALKVSSSGAALETPALEAHQVSRASIQGHLTLRYCLKGLSDE